MVTLPVYMLFFTNFSLSSQKHLEVDRAGINSISHMGTPIERDGNLPQLSQTHRDTGQVPETMGFFHLHNKGVQPR